MWSQTVYNAIKAGYRLFDGAADYGNEKEAGQGVRRALSEGIVKREELCGWSTLFLLLSFVHLNFNSYYIQGEGSGKDVFDEEI